MIKIQIPIKIFKVVLLLNWRVNTVENSRGDLSIASSYHSLCMLDIAANLL